MNNASVIDRARYAANEAHLGQTRKFGVDRPYIYHPEQVYRYLAFRLPDRQELLAAAWLHDVIEDCGFSADDLERFFGPRVARLVVEVSHPETPSGMPRRERWPIYLEHYGNASEDGKILKLADRLCNLREYEDFWSQVPEKERRFIRGVYRDETHELVDRIGDADESTAGAIILSLGHLICEHPKEGQ